MGMFAILKMVMILQAYSCVKTHQNAHLKYVQFLLQKLFLNKAVKQNSNKENENHQISGTSLEAK